MKKFISIITILVFALSSFYACKSKEEKVNEEKNEPHQSIKVDTKNKQLNITLLLDLSDRIEPTKYNLVPTQEDRDIAIVNEFVDIFKNEMRTKGNYKMKGKMRVLFSPVPQDPSINSIAQKLVVNTSDLKPVQKTELYKNLNQTFTDNLQKIYKTTLDTKQYIGSDIWSFFKNDVKDLTIDPNPEYKNILVILTDGYLFYKDNKIKEKNRYSYITPEMIKGNGLIKSDWKEKMEKEDFGLINPRPNKDLQNLEVLVLEVSPSKQSPYEGDVLNAFLSKWFNEMGVKKFQIYKTDLPEYTKMRIEKFIN